MKMDRWTQFKFFSIIAPRYHDQRVLLKCSKVGQHNKIVFTGAPSMGKEPYYASGKTIRKYPKESNGSIWCFSLPLDELQPLELSTNSELDFK